MPSGDSVASSAVFARSSEPSRASASFLLATCMWLDISCCTAAALLSGTLASSWCSCLLAVSSWLWISASALFGSAARSTESCRAAIRFMARNVFVLPTRSWAACTADSRSVQIDWDASVGVSSNPCRKAVSARAAFASASSVSVIFARASNSIVSMEIVSDRAFSLERAAFSCSASFLLRGTSSLSSSFETPERRTFVSKKMSVVCTARAASARTFSEVFTASAIAFILASSDTSFSSFSSGTSFLTSAWIVSFTSASSSILVSSSSTLASSSPTSCSTLDSAVSTTFGVGKSNLLIASIASLTNSSVASTLPRAFLSMCCMAIRPFTVVANFLLSLTTWLAATTRVLNETSSALKAAGVSLPRASIWSAVISFCDSTKASFARSSALLVLSHAAVISAAGVSSN
mmetsp:Transcript_6375/g.9791  ORF Transcript_6375/g.9791 Transcript_6375/m.9791 type:complete len:406 (-) Transcript_6375:1672-2889(-)